MQEEKNTITFLFLFFFRKVKSRRNRLSLGHTTYPCSSPATVAMPFVSYNREILQPVIITYD